MKKENSKMVGLNATEAASEEEGINF